VLELLLVTTVPVMILAQGGMPNLWLVLATVIGGAMSADRPPSTCTSIATSTRTCIAPRTVRS
jgi:heme O synthase-like polyprenyltransferase